MQNASSRCRMRRPSSSTRTSRPRSGRSFHSITATGHMMASSSTRTPARRRRRQTRRMLMASSMRHRYGSRLHRLSHRNHAVIDSMTPAAICFCACQTHAHSCNRTCTQELVYNDLGKDLLENAFEGYNCALFAYGQTGSGKSYSIIGYGANKGISPASHSIPRSISLTVCGSGPWIAGQSFHSANDTISVHFFITTLPLCVCDCRHVKRTDE